MHNKNYETNPGKAPSKREDVVSGVHLSASKRKKSRLECTTKRTQGRVYGNGETDLVLRRCLLKMVDHQNVDHAFPRLQLQPESQFSHL